MDTIERNLGEQPVSTLIQTHQLKHHDLVAASKDSLTHKMVSRACKGRRLTTNVKLKLLNAMNNVVEETYKMKDLFNY
jgi:hypothetical protein